MNSVNLSKNKNSGYDHYVKQNQKRINYNDKLKQHTEKLPKEGYMAMAVREFYSDLKDVKHNNPDLSNALKFRKRCLDSLEANDFTEPPTKVKFHQAGGGRKKYVTEVREAMYDWFNDICSRLKARLSSVCSKYSVRFL